MKIQQNINKAGKCGDKNRRAETPFGRISTLLSKHNENRQARKIRKAEENGQKHFYVGGTPKLDAFSQIKKYLITFS